MLNREERISNQIKNVEQRLLNSGLLRELPQISPEVEHFFPTHITHFEGPSGSGKSKIGSAVNQTITCWNRAAVLHKLARDKTVAFTATCQEPPSIVAQDKIKEYFKIDSPHYPTYREICKGIIAEPTQQLEALLLGRSALSQEILGLMNIFANAEDFHNLLGLFYNPTNVIKADPSYLYFLERGIPENALSMNTHYKRIKPIQIFSDRGFMSSLVYQAFMIAQLEEQSYYDVANEILGLHLRFKDRFFFLPERIFLFIPPKGEPQLDNLKEIPVDQTITDRSGEPDRYEYLFTRRTELQLYLLALKILRADHFSPEVIVLFNDPNAEFTTLSHLVIILNSLETHKLIGTEELSISDIVWYIHNSELPNSYVENLFANFRDSAMRFKSWEESIAYEISRQPELVLREDGVIIHEPKDYNYWVNFYKNNSHRT
jgi:hypothetical protein